MLAWNEVLPQHGTRFKSVVIRSDSLSVVIHDAVVWRVDSDQIDIAQFGQDLSSVILPIDEIVQCYVRERMVKDGIQGQSLYLSLRKL